MPLHKGVPYQVEHAEALDDNERVWVVPETGEACSTYEDYLALRQEYAKAVWSCNYGPDDLTTFLEALKQEQRIQPTLQQVLAQKCWTLAKARSEGTDQSRVKSTNHPPTAGACGTRGDMPARHTAQQPVSATAGTESQRRTLCRKCCKREYGAPARRYRPCSSATLSQAQHSIHSRLHSYGGSPRAHHFDTGALPCSLFSAQALPHHSTGHSAQGRGSIACTVLYRVLCAVCVGCVPVQVADFDDDKLGIWIVKPLPTQQHNLPVLTAELKKKFAKEKREADSE